ncbi:MAG: PEGA domain-containing protein [candidate division Zixibacteria bacterium]|nr:PEGA domain-containing protein [candidate division Zixibacteria bacterium]
MSNEIDEILGIKSEGTQSSSNPDDSSKYLGAIAAAAGVLSFLFMPVISFFGSASGIELLSLLSKSQDSEDLMIGLLSIAIAGSGIIGTILYSLNKIEEGATIAKLALLCYAIGIIFLIAKFKSLDGVQLLGIGAWISIICYLASAYAPRLSKTLSSGSDKSQKSADDTKIASDPRLLAREEVLRQQLQNNPLDTRLLLEHAQVLRELGNLRDAAKQAEKVLGNDKINGRCLILLAEVYHQLGDTKRVQDLLTTIEEQPRASSEDYIEIARLQTELLDDPSKASETLDAGIKAFPNNTEILANYILLQGKSGDSSGILSTAVSNLEQFSGNPDVLECILHAAIQARDYSTAYSAAKLLAPHYPDTPSVIMYSQVKPLLETANTQSVEAAEKLLREFKEIRTEGLNQEDSRHHFFVIALAQLLLNKEPEKQFGRVSRALMDDSQLYQTWQKSIDLAMSMRVKSQKDENESRQLLNHLVQLTKSFQSATLTSLAAVLSLELARKKEAKKDWKNALVLYKMSSEFQESSEIDETISRVSLHASKKRKILTIITSVTALMVISISAFMYLGQGRIQVTVKPAATIQIIKDGSIVFEQVPNVADSLSTVATPHLSMGGYVIKVTRPGYSMVRIDISIGFGRKTYSHMATLSPKFGGLEIKSQPRGASVYVDDSLVGKTPLRLDSLLAKPSNIRLTSKGYNDYDQVIDIFEDSIVNLGTVRFRGLLSVNSKPSGAKTFLNGRNIGTTPIKSFSVDAVNFAIRIEQKGSGIFEDQSITIVPMKELDLGVVELSPAGSIEITSKPSGADVYIDDVLLGKTSLRIPTISATNHTLRVSLQFHSTQVRSVGINAGTTEEVSFELKRFDGEWLLNFYYYSNNHRRTYPGEEKVKLVESSGVIKLIDRNGKEWHGSEIGKKALFLGFSWKFGRLIKSLEKTITIPRKHGKGIAINSSLLKENPWFDVKFNVPSGRSSWGGGSSPWDWDYYLRIWITRDGKTLVGVGLQQQLCTGCSTRWLVLSGQRIG